MNPFVPTPPPSSGGNPPALSPMRFRCSICEDPSSDICHACTKDSCPNHLCARCLCCSDCCRCEVSLSHSSVPHTGPLTLGE